MYGSEVFGWTHLVFRSSMRVHTYTVQQDPGLNFLWKHKCKPTSWISLDLVVALNYEVSNAVWAMSGKGIPVSQRKCGHTSNITTWVIAIIGCW